jgi:hypothetical protein
MYHSNSRSRNEATAQKLSRSGAGGPLGTTATRVYSHGVFSTGEAELPVRRIENESASSSALLQARQFQKAFHTAPRCGR